MNLGRSEDRHSPIFGLESDRAQVDWKETGRRRVRTEVVENVGYEQNQLETEEFVKTEISKRPTFSRGLTDT